MIQGSSRYLKACLINLYQFMVTSAIVTQNGAWVGLPKGFTKKWSHRMSKESVISSHIIEFNFNIQQTSHYLPQISQPGTWKSSLNQLFLQKHLVQFNINGGGCFGMLDPLQSWYDKVAHRTEFMTGWQLETNCRKMMNKKDKNDKKDYY